MSISKDELLKRKSDIVKSQFLEIPGMGLKRVNKLLTIFESVDSIAKLTPEAVNGETGIPLSIAKHIVTIAKRTKWIYLFEYLIKI